jgi:hypothetical protein
MALFQVIYASTPFGYDQGMLNGILADARRCNERDDVTGALICRADLYLHLLEGPEAAVRGAWARIARDDRHLEPVCLVSAPVDRRLFPGWAMRDDPARSWLWTREEVAAGAVARATPDEARAIFERLAQETA